MKKLKTWGEVAKYKAKNLAPVDHGPKGQPIYNLFDLLNIVLPDEGRTLADKDKNMRLKSIKKKKKSKKKENVDTVCIVCGLRIKYQDEHEDEADCIDALLKENKALLRDINKLKSKIISTRKY